MKKVLVFGTFDHLHPGHHYFLAQAAELAPYLIAVVARDCFIKNTKGVYPSENESRRLKRISGLDIVSRAILSDEIPGTYGVLENEKPDIICLGHDQSALKENLEQWLVGKSYAPEIREAPPFRRDLYQSTIIRKIKKR